MGSTATTTLKEVDTALRHGNISEAERLLNASDVHPLSARRRLYDALIALARGNLHDATYYIDEAQKTSGLTASDQVRYYRQVVYLQLRKRQLKQASATLEQLHPYRETDGGWLLSMQGRIAYLTARHHAVRRNSQISHFKKAAQHFQDAEVFWNEHGCPERSWQLDNRWWWFRTEWRLRSLFHRSNQVYLKQLDNLRWDIIDNDGSPQRQLIARLPWLLFRFADKV